MTSRPSTALPASTSSAIPRELARRAPLFPTQRLLPEMKARWQRRILASTVSGGFGGGLCAGEVGDPGPDGGPLSGASSGAILRDSPRSRSPRGRGKEVRTCGFPGFVQSGGMNAWVLALGLLPFLAQDKPQKEILHISAAGEFGTAVCILGDVDQDGVSDLAVGAPAPWDCFVAVYSGADGKEIWRVDGQMFQPEFGRALAVLGDLNADGCPDLLAAYPTRWGALDDNFNRAWVLSGKDEARLLEILGNETTLDGFASAVAPAGDLDGDAIPDMWIGAEFGPIERRLGRVTAFSGKDGHEIRHVDSPGEKLFGRSLLAMGDLDGDGAPEVVVGSSYSPERRDRGVGLVVIVSSSSGEVLSRWEGGHEGRPLYGHTVAVIPDFDGDGHQDIALGGSEVRPSERVLDRREAARGLEGVYLLGSKSGQVLTCLEGTRNRGFGSALASGDLDGNGSTELVVGEPDTDRETGTVHVFTLHSDPDPFSEEKRK